MVVAYYEKPMASLDRVRHVDCQYLKKKKKKPLCSSNDLITFLNKHGLIFTLSAAA